MKEEVVKIEKLDHHGRGIAKINNKVVFIPYTVPDDEVIINITKDKKNFCEGVVSKFLVKSDNHINQSCLYYGKCGGCDLRHMRYEEQLRFKQNKIEEILSKFTHLDKIKVNDIIASKLLDHYRNKLTLKVDNGLCLNKKATHEYIEVNDCHLADIRMVPIIKLLNKYDLKFVNDVVIRCSYFTDDIMVIFNVKKGVKFKENLENLEKMVTSIVFNEEGENQIYYGKGNIIERLDNFEFKISPDAFFQVNSNQTLNLYHLILQKCKLNGDEIVYDLYCGTGTIGIFLSPFCKKVFGVEINKNAVMDARNNAKINNVKNCEFYAEDVSKFIFRNLEKPNVIVVDPPRSGLDMATINHILTLSPKRVVYVSCDPITLSRDIDILNSSYDVCDVTPVDMFPQTFHVESVALLELRESK